MSRRLNVALAQLNFFVGAVEYNVARVREAVANARMEGADVIVFPELCITGYPPEDLLMRRGFIRQVEAAVDSLKQIAKDIHVVIGAPCQGEDGLYNSALVLYNGEIVASYDKQMLPNYAVFDEVRYFKTGKQASTFTVKETKLALSVCEDIWYPEPIRQAVDAGAEILLNLNASPFNLGKLEQREKTVTTRSLETGLPIVYVNLIGGQDELVFDGASFVIAGDGSIKHRAVSFEESISVVQFSEKQGRMQPEEATVYPHPPLEEAAYRALVLGVRDYVKKNGFQGAVLGLSGGIDSALTLTVAVDALGADNVEAVMLPSRYTADMSQEDAAKLAEALGVEYHTIAIEKAFNAFMELLADEFSGTSADVTEENIQARCRGVILMAISNKKGKIVLSTGNKSEMAVGYTTLYGDMAGGLDVLKDVPKTLVYLLSEYRNELSPVIPRRIIDRPPSAELRPDQKDSDSLPDYAELDPVLEGYVEKDMSPAELIAEGHDEAVVERISHMVDRNEYKRRQGPPGIRITSRAFGKDRRYPITSGFSN